MREVFFPAGSQFLLFPVCGPGFNCLPCFDVFYQLDDGLVCQVLLHIPERKDRKKKEEKRGEEGKKQRDRKEPTTTLPFTTIDKTKWDLVSSTGVGGYIEKKGMLHSNRLRFVTSVHLRMLLSILLLLPRKDHLE